MELQTAIPEQQYWRCGLPTARRADIAATIGPVKLVEKDGMIWSLDNRRVLTFRSAGMDIAYEKTTWDALTPAQKSHFTSTTNGKPIIILLPNQ